MTSGRSWSILRGVMAGPNVRCPACEGTRVLLMPVETPGAWDAGAPAGLWVRVVCWNCDGVGTVPEGPPFCGTGKGAHGQPTEADEARG